MWLKQFLFTVVVFCFSYCPCNAQIFKSDFNTVFAFNVKSMDDFYNRFNFQRKTEFEEFVHRKKPGFKVTREALLTNLFNLSNIDSAKEKNINNFISQVTDSSTLALLSYYDKNWYAELSCEVAYKGKPQNLKLILKVEKSQRNTFRWAIVSAWADFIKFKKNSTDSILIKSEAFKNFTNENRNRQYTYSPVSHALDFMNIDAPFIKKEHAFDYVAEGPVSFELYKLMLLIQKSQVKFVKRKSVVYHLLQVDGWILQVENFGRQTLNSGWLIARFTKSADDEKENYLMSKLHIVPSNLKITN